LYKYSGKAKADANLAKGVIKQMHIPHLILPLYLVSSKRAKCTTDPLTFSPVSLRSITFKMKF
jgi:hypothetical protein